jgi:predicted ArsR family transcriptional regulator
VKSLEALDAIATPVETCVRTASDDARTRDRVARALHQHGPQSAVALSERFGLTAAAVRRHLDGLIAAGRVEEVPERKVRGKARGRGRPAKLFALTDQGRDSFPHAYDDLAVAALAYLRETGGDAAVAAFAHRRLAPVEARYSALLDGVPADRRVGELAAALTADGYAASAEHAGSGELGVQICQHHCPVSHVAADFPQLCEAETEFLGRVLGTHVQRLATIAHGDGVCTTHVPLAVNTQDPSRLADPSDPSELSEPSEPPTSRKVHE